MAVDHINTHGHTGSNCLTLLRLKKKDGEDESLSHCAIFSFSLHFSSLGEIPNLSCKFVDGRNF